MEGVGVVENITSVLPRLTVRPKDWPTSANLFKIN